mgnify:CR=1 FL=1
MGVGRRGGLVTEEEEEEEGWRPQYALSAIVCLLGAACCQCGTDMHSSSPLTCVSCPHVYGTPSPPPPPPDTSGRGGCFM